MKLEMKLELELHHELHHELELELELELQHELELELELHAGLSHGSGFLARHGSTWRPSRRAGHRAPSSGFGRPCEGLPRALSRGRPPRPPAMRGGDGRNSHRSCLPR
jgi:hypothetical protein